MIELYANPTLLEYLYVACHATEDEKRQIEAFSGYAFNADRVAQAHYAMGGPKFGLYTVEDGKRDVLAVGGFWEPHPKVWRDWMITTPKLWSDRKYWAPATRQIRTLMDEILANPDVRVLECYSLASRTAAHRWYKPLGYVYEATLKKRAANGEDVMVYSRVKHG
jgi:hypothetical protein